MCGQSGTGELGRTRTADLANWFSTVPPRQARIPRVLKTVIKEFIPSDQHFSTVRAILKSQVKDFQECRSKADRQVAVQWWFI